MHAEDVPAPLAIRDPRCCSTSRAEVPTFVRWFAPPGTPRDCRAHRPRLWWADFDDRRSLQAALQADHQRISGQAIKAGRGGTAGAIRRTGGCSGRQPVS